MAFHDLLHCMSATKYSIWSYSLLQTIFLNWVHRKVNFAVSTSFPLLKDIFTFGEIRDSGGLPPVKMILHIDSHQKMQNNLKSSFTSLPLSCIWNFLITKYLIRINLDKCLWFEGNQICFIRKSAFSLSSN